MMTTNTDPQADLYAWIDELHDADNEPRPEDHEWLKEVLKRYREDEPSQEERQHYIDNSAPDDLAWAKEAALLDEDGTTTTFGERYLANEPQPVNNAGQAWGVIDGQPLTETDIRRLIQLNQAKQREIIRLNIEINHLNQHIVRLEREIDGGLTAVYSITPKGYDVLRELGM